MGKARIHEFVAQFSNPNPSKAAVIVAAPFVYLGDMPSTKLVRAAQDVSEYNPGAYTGEISAEQLKDVGVGYCLVGHSERRVYFAETDKQINEKVKRLLEHKIIPVICIGETSAQRKAAKMKSVLKKQLIGALRGIALTADVVIAYEPVWAISTFQKSASASSRLSSITSSCFLKSSFVTKASGVCFFFISASRV